MSKKWYDEAKKILEQGDMILKSYPIKMNGKFGWLILSSRRILFFREVGFIKKNYSIVFDKKREDIAQVNREAKYTLSIIDNTGKASTCEFELPSDIICNYLGKWIDASIPVYENRNPMIHT